MYFTSKTYKKKIKSWREKMSIKLLNLIYPSWLTSYIKLNTDLRETAENKFEKTSFNLGIMMCSEKEKCLE